MKRQIQTTSVYLHHLQPEPKENLPLLAPKKPLKPRPVSETLLFLSFVCRGPKNSNEETAQVGPVVHLDCFGSHADNIEKDKACKEDVSRGRYNLLPFFGEEENGEGVAIGKTPRVRTIPNFSGDKQAGYVSEYLLEVKCAQRAKDTTECSASSKRGQRQSAHEYIDCQREEGTKNARGKVYGQKVSSANVIVD